MKGGIATFTDDEALRQAYIEKIQRFRLLDDTFFNSCFSDNLEGMELMLRIITGRDDLTVTEMINQNEVPNKNDVLKGGKPIYHIKRMIEELDKAVFDDGAEIIYVNASFEADDALGKLMHDFHCTNPDDMNYPELAERARFFKTNEKGVRRMCEIMQEIMDEGLSKGRNEGEDRMGRLVEALVADGQNEAVARVATDKAYRAEMYEKYNIK